MDRRHVLALRKAFLETSLLPDDDGNERYPPIAEMIHFWVAEIDEELKRPEEPAP